MYTVIIKNKGLEKKIPVFNDADLGKIASCNKNIQVFYSTSSLAMSAERIEQIVKLVKNRKGLYEAY